MCPPPCWYVLTFHTSQHWNVSILSPVPGGLMGERRSAGTNYLLSFSESAPAFHVPAFQGNHIKKAGTFFPGTHVRSFVTHDARCPRYWSLTDVHSMPFVPLLRRCSLSLPLPRGRSTVSLHDLTVVPSFVHSLHYVAFNTFTPFSTGPLFQTSMPLAPLSTHSLL